MPNKIITQINEKYGVWKILEANVINPNTTDKLYINKTVFSKCICTNCNETIRYIRNNELKKYSNKKCHKCSVHDRVSKNWPKIGETFGYLTVVGDAGIQEQSSCARHYSLCQCKCGSIVEVQDNRLKTGNTQSCGKCITSKGEELIIRLLSENNIQFEHDKSFLPFVKDVGHHYRFDFIIYNDKHEVERFIEFDGRQHFYGPDTNFWGRSTDTLISIQEKDEIKNQWCRKNGYILVRIPYTALTSLTFQDLFSKKYEVIKNE